MGREFSPDDLYNVKSTILGRISRDILRDAVAKLNGQLDHITASVGLEEMLDKVLGYFNPRGRVTDFLIAVAELNPAAKIEIDAFFGNLRPKEVKFATEEIPRLIDLDRQEFTEDLFFNLPSETDYDTTLLVAPFVARDIDIYEYAIDRLTEEIANELGSHRGSYLRNRPISLQAGDSVDKLFMRLADLTAGASTSGARGYRAAMAKTKLPELLASPLAIRLFWFTIVVADFEDHGRNQAQVQVLCDFFKAWPAEAIRTAKIGSPIIALIAFQVGKGFREFRAGYSCPRCDEFIKNVEAAVSSANTNAKKGIKLMSVKTLRHCNDQDFYSWTGAQRFDAFRNRMQQTLAKNWCINGEISFSMLEAKDLLDKNRIGDRQ